MGDIHKHTEDETQDAQNQARGTSGWAIVALIVGVYALLATPGVAHSTRNLLSEWLLRGLHARFAYLVLTPILEHVLPAVALALGIVALLRPGRKLWALVGMAAAALAVWGLHRVPCYWKLLPIVRPLLPAVVLLGVVALLRPGRKVWVLAVIAAAALTLGSSWHWHNSRIAARQSCCLTNLKSMANAQLMYAQDYDGRFAPVDHWPKALYGPYLKNCQILTCPVKHAKRQVYAGMDHGGEIIYSDQVSYSMNVFLGGVDGGTLRNPREMPLEFDGTEVAGGPEAAAYRHRDGLNLSYADGHGKYLKKDEFLPLPFKPPSKQ